ncbi:hypothetical protein [Actinacidiphila acididurans]|uniref:Uncharacterized protein n=1 Tax=Actinacidiphila acididurans TaxID=2784346 RepID=A0ABS2TTS1_9ACTN|nr:hypothetical protein [Actinacidiphila acididurans]MBM9506739.1 hypothetical protein [Actinacidiphila acididurans]
MGQGPQETRVPGVRYRKVARTREVTTVLDGKPSTREVPYEAWEPVPPREWDELILRGVTVLAITVTVIAVAGTTAGVGGLLSRMVPAPVAYAMGAVFTSAWMACLGIEWLNRLNPERAKLARVGGWLALGVSMGAVVAYGVTLGQPVAGGVGACIDLLSKGLWALLVGYHAVPLDDGVAHWVTEREQELAGRELLGRRLLRLNRRAAFYRAVGGWEFDAVTAILDSAEQQRSLAGTDSPDSLDTANSEPVRTVSAQASTPAPPIVPPVSGPVPGPSGEIVPDSADTPGREAGQAASPTSLPIAATVRDVLQAEPGISNAELTERVAAVHGHQKNLAETVRRTRTRIEKPKKRNAS